MTAKPRKKTRVPVHRAVKESSADQNRWSARSQRSLKRQHELECEKRQYEKLKSGAERKLAEAETNRTRQAKQVAGGQGVFQAALRASFAEIDENKNLIAAYEEQISDLEAQIKSLQPSPAQSAERAAKQSELARLAQERVGLAGSVDSAIRSLRDGLESYRELTATMLSLAREIDFEVTGGFDLGRFESLLHSLPSGMESESRRWFQWFTGTDERSSCTIEHETDTFPETLAAPNFFVRGEDALLNESERKTASYAPPRGMTPAEFLEYGRQMGGKTEPHSSEPARNFVIRGLHGI
jgi:predicted  nucleic acid-binding Zn-ribbon protein